MVVAVGVAVVMAVVAVAIVSFTIITIIRCGQQERHRGINSVCGP